MNLGEEQMNLVRTLKKRLKTKIEMEIIKGNQSEIKNSLSEMKSRLEGINRVDKESD